jgi:hypothetical protein
MLFSKLMQKNLYAALFSFIIFVILFLIQRHFSIRIFSVAATISLCILAISYVLGFIGNKLSKKSTKSIALYFQIVIPSAFLFLMFMSDFNQGTLGEHRCVEENEIIFSNLSKYDVKSKPAAEAAYNKLLSDIAKKYSGFGTTPCLKQMTARNIDTISSDKKYWVKVEFKYTLDDDPHECCYFCNDSSCTELY